MLPLRTASVVAVTPTRRVTLAAYHARRLGLQSLRPLEVFGESAAPGVYRVQWDGVALSAVALGASALRDGLPVDWAVSPFAHEVGRFAKPTPPCGYDRVRVPGRVTLLTDASGEVVLEACRAAVVGWNGRALVVPPAACPAVASVAEAALLDSLPVERAPLRVRSAEALLLINAVGSFALELEGRPPFPVEQRARIDAVLER